MTPQMTLSDECIARNSEPDNRLDYTATDDRPTDTATRPLAWLKEALEDLAAIANLPDDWDSHGAASPDVSKVTGAWNLLCSLCRCPTIPRPYINPTRNGGVQLEWEVDDRYFEIEIVGERAATYLFCDDTACVEETGDIFEEEDLGSVLRHIFRVVRAH